MMLGMQQPLPPKMDLGHHVVAQGSSSFSVPTLATASSNTSSQTTSQSCAPSTDPALTPLARPGRPKLSLNTDINLAQTRTFGKGSTSLRLDTLSAVSPTIRNTFSNAYEPQQRSSSLPSSSSGTPVEVKRRPVLLRLEVGNTSLLSQPLPSTTPMAQQPDTSAEESEQQEPSRSGSISSSSTVSPESGIIPYSLPTHHRSILINSLLPKTDAATRIRRMSKPLFPAQKRVTFRDPLFEEVKTTKHVLAHWDLVAVYKAEEEQKLQDDSNVAEAINVQLVEQKGNLPSPTRIRLAEFKFPVPSPETMTNLSPIIFSSPQSMSSNSSPAYSPILTLDAPTTPTHSSFPKLSHSLPDRSIHHQRHLKRDSSSSNSPSSPASEENDSDDSCAHTPVAGRYKKRRMWVWTLGPLEGYNDGSSDEGVEVTAPTESQATTEVEDDFVIVEKME